MSFEFYGSRPILRTEMVHLCYTEIRSKNKSDKVKRLDLLLNHIT